MAKRVNKAPNVSVVLPAHNAAVFIEAAIQSILSQTYQNFELIVVDDGSTDKTAYILSGMQDKRLRVITQKNQGIVAALNTGIAAAKAPIIGRHDADDCSEPDRFEKQIAFLNNHSDVVLVGSSMQTMSMEGKVLHNHYVLLNDAELKQELLVRSPFAHGSVVFRKDAFIKAGGYHQADWPAEDYGLWVRMAAQGAFANLDDPLYIYRENSEGVSLRNQALQQEKSQAARRSAWDKRKQLAPSHIAANTYANLPMGQFRIARIVENILFSILYSLRRGDIIYAGKLLRLVSFNKTLYRKLIRLGLMKIGIRHGY